MYGREELKATEIYARFASEVYDDFGDLSYDQKYYRKEHADSVMDAMEARIKELESDIADLLDDKKSTDSILDERNAEISELEAENAELNKLKEMRNITEVKIKENPTHEDRRDLETAIEKIKELSGKIEPLN